MDHTPFDATNPTDDNFGGSYAETMAMFDDYLAGGTGQISLDDPSSIKRAWEVEYAKPSVLDVLKDIDPGMEEAAELAGDPYVEPSTEVVMPDLVDYIADNTGVEAEGLGLEDDLVLEAGEEDIGKPGELAVGLADEHDAEFVAGLGPAESPADDEGEISPADEEVLDDMVDDAIENGFKSDKPSGWKPYVHDADDVIQMTALKGKTEAFNEAIRKISWDLPKNATNAELVAELQGWDVEDVYTKTDQVYKYEATFEEKWKDQI